MYIKIPFQIHNGKIEREKDIIQSINEFLELIVSSAFGSFKPENDFGFIFKNFRFENFDEINGTIMYLKTKPDEIIDVNYKKKISDTSNNPNNFAFDLKKNIEKYEKRLKNVTIDMKYNRSEKLVTLQIKGKLETLEQINYTHVISFQVW
jgi:hypothetical protein